MYRFPLLDLYVALGQVPQLGSHVAYLHHVGLCWLPLRVVMVVPLLVECLEEEFAPRSLYFGCVLAVHGRTVVPQVARCPPFPIFGSLQPPSISPSAALERLSFSLSESLSPCGHEIGAIPFPSLCLRLVRHFWNGEATCQGRGQFWPWISTCLPVAASLVACFRPTQTLGNQSDTSVLGFLPPGCSRIFAGAFCYLGELSMVLN